MVDRRCHFCLKPLPLTLKGHLGIDPPWAAASTGRTNCLENQDALGDQSCRDLEKSGYSFPLPITSQSRILSPRVVYWPAQPHEACGSLSCLWLCAWSHLSKHSLLGTSCVSRFWNLGSGATLRKTELCSRTDKLGEGFPGMGLPSVENRLLPQTNKNKQTKTGIIHNLSRSLLHVSREATFPVQTGDHPASSTSLQCSAGEHLSTSKTLPCHC